jgi:murein L,D-transpeptidase YafK
MISYGVILNSSEDSLQEILSRKGIKKISNPRLVVLKSTNKLNLFDSDELIKEYKTVFGRTPYNQKAAQPKSYTPTGKYFICSIDTTFKYHKMFRINYPNEIDAAEAFKNGLIPQSEYQRILIESTEYGCSKLSDFFGNEIGIHGIGEFDLIFRNLPFVFNWTNGSIALSNSNIDELYSVVRIGTSVEIFE